jgi:hypothetical protein
VGGLGPFLMCVGVLFLLIGVIIARFGGGEATEVSPRAAAPREEDGRWGKTSPGPVAPRRPTPIAPSRRTPPAVTPRSGDSMQAQFFNARLGQKLTYTHPQRGTVTGIILGSIKYSELWQRVNKPSEPWIPTGNTFAAHWLGSFMVYEWQQRLYVLDEYQPLTDQEINTSFMPYAKRFAQSDQTAQVSFAWPPASWTIVDIGRFEVARAEGTGLRLNQGAIGRFIHARGADRRALVVEDYQQGQGGQDTAWVGYELDWENLLKVE